MDRNKCAICRIEICIVALRKESVDRNRPKLLVIYPNAVALRKESVDRNQQGRSGHKIKRVALRKESVDRNDAVQIVIVKMDTSLSARRAWIEMIVGISQVALQYVALRKESVDRNSIFPGSWILAPVVALRKESVDRNRSPQATSAGWVGSLSARRAWIEMSPLMWPWSPLNKSLSARRAWIEIIECSYHNIKLESRSPQGERG